MKLNIKNIDFIKRNYCLRLAPAIDDIRYTGDGKAETMRKMATKINALFWGY